MVQYHKSTKRGGDDDEEGKQDWSLYLPFAGKALMTFWQSHPFCWQAGTSAVSTKGMINRNIVSFIS